MAIAREKNTADLRGQDLTNATILTQHEKKFVVKGRQICIYT